MAQFIPSLVTLFDLKDPPSKEQFKLLYFLDDNLDENFEIFFKPHCDGIYPQIVIIEKNNKVSIIEFVEASLDEIELPPKKEQNKNVEIIEKERKWKINGVEKISPFDKIRKIKSDLFSFFEIPKKFGPNPSYRLIQTNLFFSKIESQNKLNEFLKKLNEIYTRPHSNNSDQLNYLLDTIKQTLVVAPVEPLMNDQLYNNFKRNIHFPLHVQEKAFSIKYTPEQDKIIYSHSKKIKVKGVAGSGKTLLAVRKAFESFKNSNNEVLFLCFNITLKNYIKDNLKHLLHNENRLKDMNKFIVNNYHNFVSGVGRSLDKPLYVVNHEGRNDFDDPYFFNDLNNPKFDTIIIDEVQDFKENWLISLTSNFLKTNGNFFVFGDEKQNIYQRKMDENKLPIIPTIKGRWNQLAVQHRSQTNISFLVHEFQKHFMAKKYNVNPIHAISNQMNTASISSKNDYFMLDSSKKNEKRNSNFIVNEIMQLKKNYKKSITHDSDICILSENIPYLRQLEHLIASQNIKTMSTVETEDQYGEYLSWHKKKYKQYDKEIADSHIDAIRSSKRNYFKMDNQNLKLSTISSFKGWEISTLCLIIDSERFRDDDHKYEHIYTALTRCKNNLFIFNIGNENYHQFFSRAFKSLPPESLGLNMLKKMNLK